MNKNFTMMLLGPAGSGKSAFIASLCSLDIFEHITAKTPGGANTTKVPAKYIFSNDCQSLNVIECIAAEQEDHDDMLNQLKQVSSGTDGIQKLFAKINDLEFAKQCLDITVQLPCKKGLITEGSKFDSIVIIDSRGLGDTEDDKKAIENIVVPSDVNAIFFFSISAIRQPVIFAKIIDRVMESNLKTPIFLLRRDSDLTQNDVDFEDKIKNNILNSDKDLYDSLNNVPRCENEIQLNTFVFNLPEVKKWKGALNISSTTHNEESKKYIITTHNIITYAVNMYHELYNIIVDKMRSSYQDIFVNDILTNLLTGTAFNIVKKIVSHPHSKPSTRNGYAISRDTDALIYPVQLRNNTIREDMPFSNEVSKRGNPYAPGVIPSYSYACVNFRAVFKNIVSALAKKDHGKILPLLNTFMDIILDDFTVTTCTGYTFADTWQNAFKFCLMTDARDVATTILSKNNLINNNSEWKSFSYTVKGQSFSNSEAIAVLIYKCLIDLLNLSQQFNNAKVSDIIVEGGKFVEVNESDVIEKKLSRKDD